jgi:polyisoprenoid-binding protein YceI
MMKVPIFSMQCLAGAALFLCCSLHAQSTVRYQSKPGASKITINGTSTLHDWIVSTPAVGGFMEIDPAFDADLKTLASTPKVEVTVPVRQLKNSELKKPMDNVMYEHMDAKDHPTIKYRLLKLAPQSSGGAGQFDAQGELTVSGVTRTNTMPVTFERVDKSTLKVKGSTNLKMTDFKIQPPTLTVLGVGIRTGDDVKLSFEWVTAQPEKTAEAK